MALNETVLEVENVSKRFALKNGDNLQALANVSFSLNTGETLGIIGSNGSGKSTLLKLLSGVMKPTNGVIKIYGSASAILDLGFGIVPSFTGRENIYFIGSLEGYSKKQINLIIDEIIEFTGLNEFIDLPVKNYSSGMYLRLAFAVKTTLASNILILDEVVGVGDAEFKIKSSERLKKLIKGKRAVILASHSPQELLELCGRLIWLDHGIIKADGNALKVMDQYLLESYENNNHNNQIQSTGITTSDPIQLHQVTIKPKNKAQGDAVFLEDDIEIDITYTKQNSCKKSEVALHIFSISGIHVFVDCLSFRPQEFDYYMENGTYTASCIIPGFFLNIGSYFISLSFIQDGALPTFDINRVAHFTVEVNNSALNDIPLNQFEYIAMNDAVTKPHLKWTLKNTRNECLVS